DDRDPFNPLQIASDVDHSQAVARRDQLADLRLLAVAKFEHQISVLIQAGRGVRYEAADDLEAVGAAKESRLRFEVAYFRLQGGARADGDVGQVGHDQIEAAGQRRQQISLHAF